jgi:hypothetical protein
MKKALVLLLVTFITHQISAQDILIKRNGDQIDTKVLEISINEIKYKRYDNLEGPIISILKTDVFMIKFENGTTETFLQTAPPLATSSLGYSAYAPTPYRLKLSGPRIGFTVMSQRTVDRIRDEYDSDLNPFITQFGWQFETRIFTLDNGVSGLFEFVPLIGGLEQGKFLPSISALVGIRGASGLEIGVGPNLSLAGAGLVFALGANFQSQGINFPVNLAFAPSQYGSRVSLLFGFNSRQ